MKNFTVYMLLLVLAMMIGVIHSSEVCFYNGKHHGKKCYYPDGNRHTCCPVEDICRNGECSSLGATPPSPSLPFQTSVFIGVGCTAFGLLCLVIGAVYWHRKQMNNTEKQLNPLSSFSNSLKAPPRSGGSAGVRIRSSTSQPSSVETSVNLEPNTITTSEK